MLRVVLAFLWILLLHYPAYGQVKELPVIDFERYFPHLIAISEEIRPPNFPGSLQWKFISVRDEQDKVVWVTLRRREGPNRVVQSFLAKGPLDSSEVTLRAVVAKFSETEKINFEIVDLRDIRKIEEFTARGASLGWGVETLPK